MKTFISNIALVVALSLPTTTFAAPYCDTLLDADQLPAKYKKRGPFFSDDQTGWIIGRDQLKADFKVTDEAVLLWSDIVVEFDTHGVELVALVAPPRPLFTPQDVRDAVGLPSDYDATKAAKSFSEYLLALNSSGITAPDLLVAAENQAQNPYYFKRDMHWTPYGAAYSAAALADHLVETSVTDAFSALSFDNEFSEKGSLSTVVDAACGSRPELEMTVSASYAKQGDANSLLGDVSSEDQSYALVGTSFSDRYQRDAYQVADALSHFVDAPVENFSVTGGGMAGAMEGFIRSGALASGKYKTVIWEAPYTAPLTNISSLRQILGALISTRDHNEAAVQSLDISKDWVEVKHDIRTNTALGVEIHTNDISTGQLDVELYDTDNIKTRIKLIKSDRVDAQYQTNVWTIALGHLPAQAFTRMKLRMKKSNGANMADIRIITN
jgi:hypothetical protein